MSSPRMGVREAKINLSKLLKKAKEGEEVTITDRGKPVRRIISVSKKAPSLAERLKRAEEQRGEGDGARKGTFKQNVPGTFCLEAYS